MAVILHDTARCYEAEYHSVRARLVAQGSSLNGWLQSQGINRQLAYRALRGQSLGRKAVALRRRILSEVLGEVE